MGEERGVYRILVGKPEGRRPLGRARRRWVDNIRTDLQEVGCGYMDWIGLAQDRDRRRTLVSAVMNLRVPWNAGNFLTSCKPVSFSRRTLHHGVRKYLVCCARRVWRKIYNGPFYKMLPWIARDGFIFATMYNVSIFWCTVILVTIRILDRDTRDLFEAVTWQHCSASAASQYCIAVKAKSVLWKTHKP